MHDMGGNLVQIMQDNKEYYQYIITMDPLHIYEPA